MTAAMKSHRQTRRDEHLRLAPFEVGVDFSRSLRRTAMLRASTPKGKANEAQEAHPPSSHLSEENTVIDGTCDGAFVLRRTSHDSKNVSSLNAERGSPGADTRGKPRCQPGTGGRGSTRHDANFETLRLSRIAALRRAPDRFANPRSADSGQ